MGKNLKGKERSVQPKVLQQLLGHASIKNNNERICSCYRRITGKCNTPISTGYAASYKKRRKKSVQEI